MERPKFSSCFGLHGARPGQRQRKTDGILKALQFRLAAQKSARNRGEEAERDETAPPTLMVVVISDS